MLQYGRLLPYSANIGEGWKGLLWTNSLVYCRLVNYGRKKFYDMGPGELNKLRKKSIEIQEKRKKAKQQVSFASGILQCRYFAAKCLRKCPRQKHNLSDIFMRFCGKICQCELAFIKLFFLVTDAAAKIVWSVSFGLV